MAQGTGRVSRGVYEPLACCVCGRMVLAAGYKFCSVCWKEWGSKKPWPDWLQWAKCQTQRERYRWKRDLHRQVSMEEVYERQRSNYLDTESGTGVYYSTNTS